MGGNVRVRSSRNCLALARQCRELAQTLHDQAARARMLKIAEDYERMAVQAAGQEVAASVSRKVKVGAE